MYRKRECLRGNGRRKKPVRENNRMGKKGKVEEEMSVCSKGRKKGKKECAC